MSRKLYNCIIGHENKPKKFSYETYKVILKLILKENAWGNFFLMNDRIIRYQNQLKSTSTN